MPTNLLDRVVNKAYKSHRKRKERQYLQSCRYIDAEPTRTPASAASAEHEPMLVSNG
jgi:hypothetical protein